MDAQRQTRSCDRQRKTRTETTPGGARQICVPMEWEQYDAIWHNPAEVRVYLDALIQGHPEIFPAAVRTKGYQLHGMLPESKKLPGVRLRQLRTADGVFTLRPSFVFSYMAGTVEELETPLFLLSMRTPIWVVTKASGRNDMSWQRLLERLGRNSLLGTTVRASQKIPEHWVADEHHLDWYGRQGFLAMAATKGCLLGAALTAAADEKHLCAAYGVSQQEALDVNPAWQLRTANLDGWPATHAAFGTLFPTAKRLLCFLHGFLKVRDRGRKLHDLHKKIWHVYHADTAADFRTRMDDLKAWSLTADLRSPVQDNLEKLFAHTEDYAASYAHADCYRTSNQVDRPMNRLARSLYASRGLHGHQASSELRLRGLCLLENFRPFADRSNTPRDHHSPAHRLNNKCYSENRLHNLQVSASLQGFHSRT